MAWRPRSPRLALVAVALLVGGCGVGSTPSSPPRSPSAPSAAVPSRRAAVAAVAHLAVKGRAPKTGYSRQQFGEGWADVGGCDTRDEILRRDLRDERFRSGTGGCVVVSGRLADPYTATTIAYVRGGREGVDIDHVVALGDAWQKGAQRWPRSKRVAFANDPLNLLAVDPSANRQKGDGDAATWLPANKSFRCTYVARQVSVKAKYDLWVTAAERDAMLRVLARCPTAGRDAAAPPRPPTAPTPSPRVFATCAAARAAGAAPIRRGTPLYAGNRGLDRDGDGVACE